MFVLAAGPTPDRTAEHARVAYRLVMGRREIAELSSNVGDGAQSVERPAEQLAAILSELTHELDSIDQMSEVESLRLRMTMDRLAKIKTVLSTVSSRVSDTEDAIRRHLP